jgi:hypothetical protein
MTTGNDIRTLIASNSEIDPERIHVINALHKVTVNIDALTEGELYAAQAVLHQRAPATVTYDILRQEIPEKPPAYDLEKLRIMVNKLGEASDGQLDTMFTKRIQELPKETTLEEMVDFLRNLRDECVFGAGASGFVMTLFNCLLEDYPEPVDAMKERRALLEEKYGMKS